jgi:hypothetical protein
MIFALINDHKTLKKLLNHFDVDITHNISLNYEL